IESKLSLTSLKCEICKVPYRIISRTVLRKTRLVDFLKNPSNKKLNFILFCVFILGLVLVSVVIWSLVTDLIQGDMTLKIMHYVLMGVFILSNACVLSFYLLKMIQEDWNFVQEPRGKAITLEMVSRKNRWKLILIED